MHITIDQKRLKEALTPLKIGISTRTVLPILTCVLIEARDGAVAFRTTDLMTQSSVRETEGVTINEDGACAVDYRRLLDCVKTLPKTALISLIQRGTAVEVAAGKHTALISGQDAEDYPALPSARVVGETYDVVLDGVESTYKTLDRLTQEVSLDREALVEAVSHVTVAAAADESRPVFTGVHVELRQDVLTLVAADAFRLAQRELAVPGAGSWEHDLLIPAKPFLAAVKALPKKSTVSLRADFTQRQLLRQKGEPVAFSSPSTAVGPLTLQAGNVTVQLRLLEGTYPNFRYILPKSWRTRLVVGTQELFQALKAADLATRCNSNLLYVTVQEGAVQLVGKDEDGEQVVSNTLPAATNGPGLGIILNCQYLMDAIKVTNAPKVAIELTESTRPILVKPEGDRQGAYRCSHVIMPMHSHK